MKDIEAKLRLEIKTQLQKVTRANSPLLWQKIQSREGYQKVEEQIIERMLGSGLTPAAVIPQMEVELGE